MRRAAKREFVIDNLLVWAHFIIVMIRWTGLAPWECVFPFPGSLISTFLGVLQVTSLLLRRVQVPWRFNRSECL